MTRENNLPGLLLCRIILVTGINLLTVAASGEVNVSGYLKSFAVVQDEIALERLDVPAAFQSQNSSRLMLDYFGDNVTAQVHYELNPVYSSRRLPGIDPTFAPVDDSYRLTDIETVLSLDNKTTWYQNLDRFNLQWQLGNGDLTVGRQAISFGSARIINPSDVFLPFDVRTFNTEYRNGVDAVRFQRAMGDLGELDIGFVSGPEASPDDSAAFLQTRLNFSGVDYSFAVIRYARQNLVSAGMQSSIGEFGFWLEIAAVSGDDSYVRASTGLDYAFSENLFGQVEYHYNGAGRSNPAEYLTLSTSLAYRKGGVFLLGEHYLMPSLTLQPSALWNFSVQGIVNLSDNSLFASISGERSLTDNLYSDIGVYFFAGDKPTAGPGFTLIPGSEYGANPATFFVSLRYYF